MMGPEVIKTLRKVAVWHPALPISSFFFFFENQVINKRANRKGDKIKLFERLRRLLSKFYKFCIYCHLDQKVCFYFA